METRNGHHEISGTPVDVPPHIYGPKRVPPAFTEAEIFDLNVPALNDFHVPDLTDLESD